MPKTQQWKTLKAVVKVRVPDDGRFTERDFARDVQQICDAYQARDPLDKYPSRPRTVSFGRHIVLGSGSKPTIRQGFRVTDEAKT